MVQILYAIKTERNTVKCWLDTNTGELTSTQDIESQSANVKVFWTKENRGDEHAASRARFVDQPGEPSWGSYKEWLGQTPMNRMRYQPTDIGPENEYRYYDDPPVSSPDDERSKDLSRFG